MLILYISTSRLSWCISDRGAHINLSKFDWRVLKMTDTSAYFSYTQSSFPVIFWPNALYDIYFITISLMIFQMDHWWNRSYGFMTILATNMLMLRHLAIIWRWPPSRLFLSYFGSDEIKQSGFWSSWLTSMIETFRFLLVYQCYNHSYRIIWNLTRVTT